MKDSPKSLILVARLCDLLGCVAIKTLSYLDNDVYRELKRRNHLREERKKEGKKNKKTNTRKSAIGDATVVSSLIRIMFI